MGTVGYAESHAESHPMFSLKNKYTLMKPIHKIDFIKYSSLATINNNNSNISISLPSENAYICLQHSFISLEFEVLKMMIQDTPTVMKKTWLTLGPLLYSVKLS